MKQCGNCWGLLSTLGLTGRVGGASGGRKRTGTLISQAVVLGENIIRKWKCNWKSESGIGESIIRKWKFSFSSSEHDQITISLGSEIACGKSKLRQNHDDWAHQRGCRQLKTRPHCQGIQRKALGIWPIIMVIDIFNHSNTWLASAPLSRQPYWMPRPIPKRKTQIGFAQNWLPCYCIVSVLLLSCYCIVSVLL